MVTRIPLASSDRDRSTDVVRRMDVPPRRNAARPSLVARWKQAEGIRLSVAIPAMNAEDTIAAICEAIRVELMENVPLVDQLVVVDGGSADRTVERARAAGAQVLAASTLLPAIPSVPGKGESVWRSLAAVSGDIVVFLDDDMRSFSPRSIWRLLTPLLASPATHMVKGFYGGSPGDGAAYDGGRVTELVARPLLATFFPELSGVRQPLSGDYAIRRDLVMRLPIFTGHSLETGLLIDLLGEVGVDALTQVDLGVRDRRSRSVKELTPMAASIARTIVRRAEEWGRIKTSLDYATNSIVVPRFGDTVWSSEVLDLERPPMAMFMTDVYPALRRAKMSGSTMSA